MATVRGGEKLDAALKELSAKVKRGGLLRVGFLEGATYPDGTPVAMIAAINEYGRNVVVKRERSVKGEVGGNYYQLPRPFFRNMIAAKSGEWPAAIALNLKRTNYDTKQTLKLAGEEIAGQLRQSISDLTSPPLAPSTIKAKGFDKPLIGGGPTGGHMLNSVDYEIKS